MILEKLIKLFKNTYILVSVIFIVWMLFFDSNSWLFTQRELNSEIKKLEQERAYLESEIQKDLKTLENLKKDKYLEKFAREIFFLRKPNEDVFVIDTTSYKNLLD